MCPYIFPFLNLCDEKRGKVSIKWGLWHAYQQWEIMLLILPSALQRVYMQALWVKRCHEDPEETIPPCYTEILSGFYQKSQSRQTERLGVQNWSTPSNHCPPSLVSPSIPSSNHPSTFLKLTPGIHASNHLFVTKIVFHSENKRNYLPCKTSVI